MGADFSVVTLPGTYQLDVEAPGAIMVPRGKADSDSVPAKKSRMEEK